MVVVAAQITVHLGSRPKSLQLNSMLSHIQSYQHYIHTGMVLTPRCKIKSHKTRIKCQPHPACNLHFYMLLKYRMYLFALLFNLFCHNLCITRSFHRIFMQRVHNLTTCCSHILQITHCTNNVNHTSFVCLALQCI